MADPLRRNAARPHVLPVKYGDNLYLREMSDGDIERFTVRKIKLRARISDPRDPSDPSAVQTQPIYGPINIPGIEGRRLVGAYAPAFSIDPSGAFNPSSPDPSHADIGVVRVITALSGPRSLRFGFFSLDDPGRWPGATSGTLVTPNIEAPGEKYGLGGDFRAAEGGVPVTSTNSRPYVVAQITQETDPSAIDYSDPSSMIEYQLMFNNGTRIRDSVSATADQPEVGRPWPLDQEDSQFNHQILDTHQNLQRAYPRRNAYVVPNISDDPLAGDRQADHNNPLFVVAVRTENTQDPVLGNDTIQRVTLSNGTTVDLPIGVTVVPGQEYDPSGNDPSAVDPSGLSPEAIDPTDWWEFEMFLILEQDDVDDGTVGAGYAADPWPVMPADLGINPSDPPAGGEFEPIGV